MAPVSAKVVTIITAFEARELVLTAFAVLGVRGFSTSRVEGVGVHGHRRSGLVEAENLVFVIVASEELAERVLEWVGKHLVSHYASIAYSTNARAVAAKPIA